MSTALMSLLRHHIPTGSEGFEGLITRLLEKLTGRHFYLARSGSQKGRDITSDTQNFSVIAVECKRYGKHTELDERGLLGELVQAVRDIPDLDLWVLVASRSIPSQVVTALTAEAQKQGVEFLSISADDRSPSSLAALCSHGSDVVLQYVESELCSAERQELHRQLDAIVANSQYNSAIDHLRARFSSVTVGYDHWRETQNTWLTECFRLESKTRAEFGQPLNVEGEGVHFVQRRTAWSQLDTWLSKWREDHQSFVLLGEEGDGKTWAVASWLSRKICEQEHFPPVVFVSSKAAESQEPLLLLEKVLERQRGILREGFWKKRMNRWLQRDEHSAPLLLLILDGINECQTPSWWRGLLEKLSVSPWRERVALLVTCRSEFWVRYFSILRYLPTRPWSLPPYDEDELSTALTYHHLRRSEIADNLLPLITKPRYFDLVVKHRQRMKESGDITVARLIYEDWRDRVERKTPLTDLDNETFQSLIRNLARKSQEGTRSVSQQELNTLLSPQNDRQNLLNELSTGGILERTSTGYRVNERLLICGFGLLLADQVAQAAEEGKLLNESIGTWLEPHAGMDLKAAICGAAVLHALSVSDFTNQTRVALLQAWITSQNPGPEIERSFSAYVPLSPESYVELAEVLWSDAYNNPQARELLTSSLLRWSDSPQVVKVLHHACERWLGFVHPCGFPLQRGDGGKAAEEVRSKIAGRVGRVLQPGRLMFADYPLTVIENDGLLYLGRAALTIISHLPRGQFLRSIAIGCLAEAIMDMPDKYELFAWVMRSAPEPVWSEVQQEVQGLLSSEHIVTTQAAYRLLSFEGSVEAHRLQQTFPSDVFPDNWMRALHDRDPCTSGFSWSRTECETCVRREDLEPLRIARQIKTFCADPQLVVPTNFGERLEPLGDAIAVESVWVSLGTTKEDLTIEEIEPALCAYNPTAYVKLIRRIFCQAEARDKSVLWPLAHRLREYGPILGPAERASIRQAWEKFGTESSQWHDTDRNTESFLLRFVLEDMEAPQQLSVILDRPPEARDLIAYERLFRPVTNWGELQEQIHNLLDAESLQRILWFICTYPQHIPADLLRTIADFVTHKDTVVRWMALRLLCECKDATAVKSIVGGSWAWHADQSSHEHHWGSLLLCEYGGALPYEELRARIHPAYLGYAIEQRGNNTNEVHQYAEDIHRVWEALGTHLPDLPVEFPGAVVARSRTNEGLGTEEIGLSNSAFARSALFVYRKPFWQGSFDDDRQIFYRQLQGDTQNSEQALLQVLRETIAAQQEAGNTWFARYFSRHALAAVVRGREDLVAEWLAAVQSEAPEAQRRMLLGRSFYEALCDVLLRETPTKGLVLYERLEKSPSGISFVERGTEIPQLIYSLFSAAPTSETVAVWNRQVQQCRTDRELMTIAIAAQAGNGNDWLWASIQQKILSPVLFEQAKAYSLAAFVDTKESAALLQKKLEGEPETWIGKITGIGLQRWNANEWARYWYRRFLTIEDDILAWAAFRLFLWCVDSRFWLWRALVETEINLRAMQPNRWVFLEGNEDTIENHVRQNEKSLKEHFLGQKILGGKVWPWG